VLCCELAELDDPDDPDAAVRALAALLGLPPRRGGTPAARVFGALTGRRYLLLLDNCEHLLPHLAGFIESLVRRADGSAVLATSREPLGADGERVCAVEPLPVRHDGSRQEPPRADAVTLFLDRAQAANPGNDPARADLPAITELCRRLDGLPLAVELAAARTRSLSVPGIMRRLDQQLEILRGGPRTAAHRHHSLRAAMDWSYRLLTDREREVFAQLGALPEEFSLEEAVRAVTACGPELPAAEAVTLVLGLVERSLLHHREADGVSRYRMLRTVRRYALEQLAFHRHSGRGHALADTAPNSAPEGTQNVFRSHLLSVP
jgi:predicted ATPase